MKTKLKKTFPARNSAFVFCSLFSVAYLNGNNIFSMVLSVDEKCGKLVAVANIFQKRGKILQWQISDNEILRHKTCGQ